MSFKCQFCFLTFREMFMSGQEMDLAFQLLDLRSLDDYFRVSQFSDSVLLGTTLFDNVCWLPLLPWAVVVDLLVLTCKQSLFYFSTSKQMMVNGSDHLCSVSGS